MNSEFQQAEKWMCEGKKYIKKQENNKNWISIKWVKSKLRMNELKVKKTKQNKTKQKQNKLKTILGIFFSKGGFPSVGLVMCKAN